MRRASRTAAVLTAFALGSLATVSAQGVPWRLVQSGDGTLYVIAEGVRHVVVPAVISDDELGAIAEGEPWGATFGASAPAGPPAPAPAPPVEAPGVSAEVVFTYVNPEERLLRFVAPIRNGFSRTVEGVTTRWEAIDATGAIVGTQTTRHTAIPAGGTLLYVGGAGSVNLTGVPAGVQLTVIEQGRLSDAPSRLFAVDSVELSNEGTSRRAREREFRVAANITTAAEAVQRSDVTISAILRDAAGNIVGASFERPDNVPETLPPATKFRTEVRFIETTGPAASAEVIAYAR